uniref:Uncharacterized protein n=1 Tax=Desertifilum tharense IPPAS B-1220 TaxID=1781255 RepID=A0A1E5QHX7_9CYAN|nr:hypothetical protein BH720_15515 [Desertifilum tharense IPPAS B-1220]
MGGRRGLGIGSWGLGKKRMGGWGDGGGKKGVRSWARILVNQLLFQISTQNSALTSPLSTQHSALST